MAKILIIDDEEDIVMLLRQRLEQEGFEIDFAYDGQVGLKKTKEFKPDLILLDVVMPIMNGYQVCRSLKQDATTASIPVLICTAKGQESDRFWGKECGASDYIVKPFDYKEMLGKIRSLVSSSPGTSS